MYPRLMTVEHMSDTIEVTPKSLIG
jgi:hypothetical protein